MNIKKVIAIVGAALILLSFFLPWFTMSYDRETMLSATGYGFATGKPSVNDKFFLGYESLVGLGDLLGVEGLGGFSGQVNFLNRMFSIELLFVLPAVAIIVILFSLLSNAKAHMSYGIVLCLLAVGTAGFVVYSLLPLQKLADFTNTIMYMTDGQFGLFVDEVGDGVYGTGLGLLIILVAGLMPWQSSQTQVASQP